MSEIFEALRLELGESPMAAVSILIAAISFLVSTWAAFKAVKVGNSQQSLNEKLLAIETEKEEGKKRAFLSATFSTLGTSNHKLNVFNKGEAVAKNVTIEFPDEDPIVRLSDIEALFPLEKLEPHVPAKLDVDFRMTSKLKFRIVLRWDDDAMEGNFNDIIVTRG